MPRFYSLFRAFAVFAVCSGLSGCGASELRTRPVVAVDVEVLHQGKAAAGAQVVLHPAQSDVAGFLLARPHGVVAADGSVRLTTYHTDDGAPEGDYVVTVIWTPPLPANAMPASTVIGGITKMKCLMPL